MLTRRIRVDQIINFSRPTSRIDGVTAPKRLRWLLQVAWLLVNEPADAVQEATFFGGVGETLGAYGRGLLKVLDPDTEPMFTD